VAAEKVKKAKRPTHVGEVASTERLTPSLVRVVLGGEGLAAFRYEGYSDSYVKVQIPPPGAPYAAPFDLESIKGELPREQWPRVRSITVRRWDAELGQLTLDFFDHGDTGFAGPWASSAQPGDLLQLLGPGGDYSPDPTADWHLMVGDSAALPAISASLERVPEGVPVIALLAVEDAADQLELSSPGRLDLRWFTGPPGVLAEAVERAELPAGRGHAFVHGEAEMVRAVRRHLLVDCGLPRESLSASGYWKQNRTDEDWRAEKSEWKRLAEADVAGIS
jgi:NADPH-dependent ferric siderophore reductase